MAKSEAKTRTKPKSSLTSITLKPYSCNLSLSSDDAKAKVKAKSKCNSGTKPKSKYCVRFGSVEKPRVLRIQRPNEHEDDSLVLWSSSTKGLKGQKAENSSKTISNRRPSQRACGPHWTKKAQRRLETQGSTPARGKNEQEKHNSGTVEFAVRKCALQSACPYWNGVPPGAIVGDGYGVVLWSFLQKPQLLCHPGGSSKGRLIVAYCNHCRDKGLHWSEKCPERPRTNHINPLFISSSKPNLLKKIY
ncbi:hypothetical protein DVH24_001618 [Malus domestica]|uniref:Uncharacterized protein n=1 Tax=Malus domestica TaxID=3750 RepID=A0A498KY27_MALDO|nr:hypothetical protein DVH24_001618 [Malus domestica]